MDYPTHTHKNPDPNPNPDPLPTSSDTTPLTFLPINQPSSPGPQRARRGYQSCDTCREKKKLCVTDPGGATCRRCQGEGRVCRTTVARKRRRIRSSVGVEGLVGLQGQQQEQVQDQVQEQVQVQEQPRRASVEIQVGRGTARVSTPSRGASTKERILSTHLLDASDALDLIAVAGSKENIDAGRLNEPQLRNVDAQPRPSHGGSSCGWKQFFLVKRGIVRADEAVEYLDFYLSMLWHLFPVVPQYYSSPDRYTELAATEPVLTVALIALASRYHILSGYNGTARSGRVHWRTWPWVQKLFQSSMWGSSGMRSYGAIAALLLFVEWHPKAINSPEDFISDRGELELFEPNYQSDGDAQTRPSIPERLNLVATAMLLSSAIALAQEIGCFDDHTHEATPGAALNHEWTRILRTFLRLTDESLALRLRLEPQLSNAQDLADHIPSNMVGDPHWESGVELGIHMRKARELLRSWRKGEAGSGAGVPLGAWEGFRRGLDRWKRQREFSNEDRELPLRSACLDIEYYYIRLCGLSPAAHIFERQAMDTSLSQFVDDATAASVDMLHCVLHRLAPTGAFKYAGVKIWLSIVCAALYLLKITLKTEDRLDRSSARIQLILRVVDSIKQNSPDDVHMAQRYAALLEILVNAALKSCAGEREPAQQNEEITPSYQHYNTAGGIDDGLDLTGDWIYGSEFWDSLPDMVGLNSVSNLFLNGE
ncbi:hypothetical protein BJY00DRAFT_310497 [Aspergillus carlsbadensis]|nr:hypothetical protein BJY00DRAFT_310497 [Aspergillus carlsbadensis]